MGRFSWFEIALVLGIAVFVFFPWIRRLLAPAARDLTGGIKRGARDDDDRIKVRPKDETPRDRDGG